MNTEKFSYFLPPIWRESSPAEALTLEETWEYISGRKVLEVQRINNSGGLSPLGTLQAVTDVVRSLPPETYSDKIKGKVTYLPLVTFGGIFSSKDGENLQETSGLINLDIDHISLLGLSLEELKDRLSQDREIGLRLIFTSPSGDGLKLVCKTSGVITDRETYRREFTILNSYVSQKYSLPIGSIGLDKGISNINRGCLLCYDSQAVLRDWEDTFHPETHPLPPEKSPRPPRKSRPEGGDSRDIEEEFKYFVDERLIPALFERTDSVFPEMSFRYRGNRWESPFKLDGTDPKTPRRDKSVITSRSQGVILEQGGEALSVLDYYSQKHSLQNGETLRELSRLCGLEEEYRELSRRYAEEKKRQNNMTRKPTQTESRDTGSQETLRPTPKTPTEETPEERELRYSKDFLSIPSLKDVSSTKREGIVTGYKLKRPRGGEEALVLPSGALTLVCGRSSHGKTRLLQNLALRIAEEERLKETDGGEVLYFSFEEGLSEVVERFANIAVNIPHLSKFESTNNTDVLRDYFQTGRLNKAPREKEGEILPRLQEFEDLYSSGKLRLYYTPELYSGDLCLLLRFLSSKLRIKAVFLDYVQAIYKEGRRQERREELRDICDKLNKTAIELKIPIILSAQLNRETKNPTQMSGDNIAESADITRYANTILLLWDSLRIRDVSEKDSYIQTEDYSKKLLSEGFILGQPGKLYAVATKNRGGTPDIEGVWDYVPETGRVLIPGEDDLPADHTPRPVRKEYD